MATLLHENNLISLRTAIVGDDGNLVDFCLMPADLVSLIPRGRKWSAPKDFEWVSKDSAWLYRHMRSASEEIKLMGDFPCVEQDVRPMVFENPPEFRLLWTGSGNSVALYLNGELWTFIEEVSHKGYSKGILKPGVGNPWNQVLFEKTFLT